MLRELHIKNLAIIEDVSIEFDEGLNVLTGETGAGKSIIIDALGLCIGERASSVLIRSGEKEATVEAFFEIPPLKTLADMAIEQDEGIIMKRIISSSGKSRAYINGALVNVQTLSEVSRDIIDIHGQYEHQSLLLPENQLEMIDAYGRLLKDREDFSVVYAKLMALRQQMEELTVRERERVQKIDMLKFQIGEIEASGLKKDEEEALAEELKILSNTERLLSLANEAYDSLYASEGAAQNSLSKAINAIREIASIDNRATETLRTIEEAMPLIEEASMFLRGYKDSLDFNPSRLEALQERHELIKRLIKKYGANVQEILDYKEKAQRELNELQSSEERLEYLKAEIEDLRKILTEKANNLSEKRKAVAGQIEKKVVAELGTLSMPHTRFSIKMFCEQGEDTIDGFKANSKGIDRVEYLISPNPGEELRPLSKTASGGELSRVMLALKGLLSGGDRISILVFDEIDAGIGGKAADTVGGKLKALSKNHQVICITHLPQIASYGDMHLKIEKTVKAGRTAVKVRSIAGDDRVMELARMLSGGDSEVSIEHAKEMLRNKTKKAAGRA